MQPPPALDERQTPQVGTVEPEKVEGHVTGRLLAPEKVNENRAAGLVDRDHLAVDYGLVEVEHGRQLLAERLEAAQDVAVARDETATTRLEVAEATETIIFELKEPFGVVERLLSPRRDDRLYAGKCHPADMARPAPMSTVCG